MAPQWPRQLVSIRLVLLFQTSSLFIREFFRRHLVQAGYAGGSADHLSALGGFLVLAIMLMPLLIPVRSSLGTFFRLPPGWRRVLPAAIAAGILLRAAGWCISVGLVHLGFRGDPEATAAGPVFWWHCPPGGYLALSVSVLALATPMVEETLSRGLILGGLLARGVRASVPVSAALFAAFHAPHNLAIAFLFGVVAARMMLSSRSLLGPVLAHATFNGLTVLDWDCLNGIWTPASISRLAGLAWLLAAAGLWVATLGLARSGVAGPSGGPGAPVAATRRSPPAR
jgi:membrane protease YdiL (CAAX protease family)